MQERTLTTLIFGNVVIESNLRGAELRIYSEDWRGYQRRTDCGMTFRAPLDDIRGTVPERDLAALTEKFFEPAAAELEAHYPGGVEQAQKELAQWLSAKA